MTRRTKEQIWELRRRIRKLAAKGLIKSDIARRCDVSFTTVHDVLAAPPIDRRARAAERRTLWAAQADQGLSFREIARRSGVSDWAVRAALRAAAEARQASDRTPVASEGEA